MNLSAPNDTRLRYYSLGPVWPEGWPSWIGCWDGSLTILGEWIEFIIVAVLLWLLMVVAISELELSSFS